MTKKKTAAAPATVAPMPESFDSPESSTIAGAHYLDGAMTVYFKRGERQDRYDYTGIPYELWEAWKAVESKGRFFSTQIRPSFAGRKYGD